MSETGLTENGLERRQTCVLVEEGESGQAMVEYALVLVLIAVVVIVILVVLGHQVSNVFSNISNGLR